MSDAVLTDSPSSSMKLQYSGETLRFAGIVALNLLLQIVTLGIFRFWARTRERRYIWSNVNLADEPLEYTGTGMELFIGFLIVTLIIGPLIGGFVFAINLASNPILVAILTVVYLLVIYFLVHVAAYRARRYRLTRTLWRGIRGTLAGSSVLYALRGLGYSLLSVVTLGLAVPIQRIGLTRIEIENMYFGDRAFSFDGSARGLFKYWLVPWVGLIALAAAYFSFLSLTQGLNPEGFDRTDPAQVEQAAQFGQNILAAMGYLALAAMVYGLMLVWYRVREFRYLSGSVSYEGLRFGSSLGLGRVIWIYVSFVLVAMLVGAVLTVGLGFVAMLSAGAGMDPAAVERGMEAGSFDPDGPMPLIMGLVFVIVMGTLSRVMVFHRLVHAVVTSLSISGEQDFAAVAQAVDSAPTRGEGLADAFDLGDF